MTTFWATQFWYNPTVEAKLVLSSFKKNNSLSNLSILNHFQKFITPAIFENKFSDHHYFVAKIIYYTIKNYVFKLYTYNLNVFSFFKTMLSNDNTVAV